MRNEKGQFRKNHTPWNIDKKCSQETKDKISHSKKGSKHSKKAKEKISMALSHQWKTGQRKVTQKTKNKIRKTLKKYFTTHKSPVFKNGQIQDKSGYILVLSPNHPFSNNHGYVRKARLIMEQKIGRYLTSKEVVHHINKITNDNRPENLKLFSSNTAHMREHARIRLRNSKGDFI